MTPTPMTDDTITTPAEYLDELDQQDVEAVELHFQGEAWIDDRAVATDDSCTYEVPISDLRSGDGEGWRVHDTVSRYHVSDDLRHTLEAPQMARKWQGPFTITLENYEGQL